jgi:hypothetical protein
MSHPTGYPVMNTSPRFSTSKAGLALLREGKLQVDSHQLELATLDEQRFLRLFPHSELRHGGVGHVNYRLASIDVEGEPCFAQFYFARGTWQLASLTLDRDYGDEWSSKIWEESYLEMEAMVHASWLGHLLGRDGSVQNATLEWGDAGVSIDKKGWGIGLTLSPRWTRLPENK